MTGGPRRWRVHVAAALAAALLSAAPGTGAAPAAGPASPAARSSAGGAATRALAPRQEGPESRRIGESRGAGDLGGWLRTLAAMAGVVALIFIARAVLRRFTPAGRPAHRAGPIEVIAHATLGPRQQVWLVRLGTRLVLVGSGPQGAMSALAEVTDTDEAERLMAQAAGKGRQQRPGAGEGESRQPERKEP